MAIKKLVILSIESNEYGFLVKLQVKLAGKEVEGLGNMANHQETYYLPLASLAKPQAELLGKEVDLNIEDFDLRIKEFTIPEDSTSNPGKEIETKWLYAKS